MDQLEPSSRQEQACPILSPTPAPRTEKGSSAAPQQASTQPLGCEEAELHPAAQERKAWPRAVGSALPSKCSPCLHSNDSPQTSHSVRPWAAQAGLGHLPQSITQHQPAQLPAPCSVTALPTSFVLVVIPAFPVSKVPCCAPAAPVQHICLPEAFHPPLLRLRESWRQGPPGQGSRDKEI